MKVLAVNAGSSSLKFQLFQMPEEEVILKGEIERIGLPNGIITIKYNGNKEEHIQEFKDHRVACKVLLDLLIKKAVIKSFDEIKAVAHRVVQGGEIFVKPTVINDEVIKKIEELSPLAPLHNPANLTGIKSFYEIMPDSINVACFDTEFHSTMPRENFLYPIPYEYYEKYKIRKYGFHGMSHQYVSEVARETLGKKNSEKLIVAHLGNGCSLTAILDGKSLETSMGLTPLDGVPMGTRSGSVDPAIVNFLVQNEGLKVSEVENILNKKSGLLGLSGISSDSRDILKARSEGHERATLAMNLQIKGIVDYIGRYYVLLQGLDAIIFTAGIGENSYEYREEIAKRLSFLGVKLDDKKNKQKPLKDVIVSAKDSKIKVLVIPTNEELMMARSAYKFFK